MRASIFHLPFAFSLFAFIGFLGCGTHSWSGKVATLTYDPSAEEVPTGFIKTSEQDTSTFGADVDTGSYTLTRRHLNEGKLPDSASVRVEEFINYFKYDYPLPTEEPFRVHLEGGPAPFGENLSLLKISIKAKEFPIEQRKPVNLVFLIDVSGSMQGADRIGLIKYALGHLVRKLEPSDTLGIVVYAGADRVLLEPTPVQNKAAILDALDNLTIGGSTAGEAGIRKAYALAEAAKRDDGINRVVLCTDGDFNVGASGQELYRLIESFRDKGVFLTTLGFGTGNYKDETLEQLADRGNGQYAYLDSPNEALRVLGENLVGTLQVVAKDVKIQVQFKPDSVTRYRLIGYDNRRLRNEDFTNDKVDSGDVGAGHYVSALYEVELVPGASTAELATVRVRFKPPEGDTSTEVSSTFPRSALALDLEHASQDFRFIAAVAEFGEILRKSPESEGARFDEVLRLVRSSTSESSGTDKLELIQLVEKAQALSK